VLRPHTNVPALAFAAAVYLSWSTGPRGRVVARAQPRQREKRLACEVGTGCAGMALVGCLTPHAPM